MKDREISNFLTWIKMRPLHLRIWFVLVFAVRALTFLLERRARKILHKKKKVVIGKSSDKSRLEFNRLEFLAYEKKSDDRRILRFREIDVLLATGIVARFDPMKPDAVEFSDEQDIHSYFRFKSLPFAVQGSAMLDEGDKKQFAEWMINKPYDSFFLHPYNVSERLVSLVCAMSLSDRGTHPADTNLLSAIYLQAKYLRNNFEFNLGNHNHVINNARALLTVATFFVQTREVAEWRDYAVKVFCAQWPHQVLDDGVHAEQSTTYHFLLTRTLWEMKQLIEGASMRFPFDNDLVKMIRFARAVTRPDGTIPLIGHITPDWHWRELVGLLPVWGHSDVSESRLARLLKKEPSNKEVSIGNESILLFPSAGIGVLRSENVHLVMCCDPRCELAIHGDQNLLGVDLWYNGTHLIRDAGLVTYNRTPERTWYESWRGQSTFCVDGFDPLLIEWRKRQLPEAYSKAEAVMDGIEASRTLKAYHTAYSRLPDPVRTGRVVTEQEGTVIIEDTMDCKAAHTYQANFHFGANHVEFHGENSLLLSDPLNGNQFEMTWVPGMTCELEDNPFAVAYGSQMNGTTGAFRFFFEGRSSVKYMIKRI